jgi:hypothetical protein
VTAQGQLFCERPDLIYLDRLALFPGFLIYFREHTEIIRMRAGLELDTTRTVTTGCMVVCRGLTQQHRRDVFCKRRLAHAGLAGQQQGMRHTLLPYDCRK